MNNFGINFLHFKNRVLSECMLASPQDVNKDNDFPSPWSPFADGGITSRYSMETVVMGTARIYSPPHSLLGFPDMMHLLRLIGINGSNAWLIDFFSTKLSCFLILTCFSHCGLMLVVFTLPVWSSGCYAGLLNSFSLVCVLWLFVYFPPTFLCPLFACLSPLLSFEGAFSKALRMNCFNGNTNSCPTFH